MKKGFLKAAIGALALTAMMGFACADDFTNKEGTWEFNAPAEAMADPDAKLVITYSDEHDGWGDLGLGFSEGEAWKSVSLSNSAGEDVDFVISIADVIEQCGITDVSALTYGKIEGYNGCTISNVAIKTDFVNNEGIWEFTDPANALSNPDDFIEITYSDEHDGWGDLGLGFSEGEAWKSVSLSNPAGVDATYVISVADLIEQCGITDVSALTYGKVEGYNGCTISKVRIVAAVAPQDVDFQPNPVIEITPDNNYVIKSDDYDIPVGKFTTSLHFSKDIWNDWCPAFVKFQKGDEVKYIVLAGAQVTWDLTIAVDEEGEGALIIPVDYEKYEEETPAVPADLVEWKSVAAGENVDLSFDIDGSDDWSITFYSLAWNNSDPTVDDPDGTAKELPVKNDAGEDITERYVYTIGIPVAEEEEEPIVEPNGDKEETTPTPTPTEKPVEKQENKATESAKTGDATSVAVLSVVALLALAGVVVTKKNRA